MARSFAKMNPAGRRNPDWGIATATAVARIQVQTPRDTHLQFATLLAEREGKKELTGFEPVFFALLHQELRNGRVDLLAKATAVWQASRHAAVTAGDLLGKSGRGGRLYEMGLLGDEIPTSGSSDGWGAILSDGLFTFGDFTGDLFPTTAGSKPSLGHGTNDGGPTLGDLHDTAVGQVSDFKTNANYAVGAGATAWFGSLVSFMIGSGAGAAIGAAAALGFSLLIGFVVAFIGIVIAAVIDNNDKAPTQSEQQPAPAGTEQTSGEKKGEGEKEKTEEEKKKGGDEKKKDEEDGKKPPESGSGGTSGTPNPTGDEGGPVRLTPDQTHRLLELINDIRHGGASDHPEDSSEVRANAAIISRILVVNGGDIDPSPESENTPHRRAPPDAVATFDYRTPASDRPENSSRGEPTVDVVVGGNIGGPTTVRALAIDYGDAVVYLGRDTRGAITVIATLAGGRAQR